MSTTTAVPATQTDVRNIRTKSSITYVLEHPFHTVEGVSEAVESSIILNPSTKEIVSGRVTVPVKSFDSGNRTRDKSMRKVTEAAKYPDIQFESSRITSSGNQLKIEGKLTFHGITKEIELTAEQKQVENNRLVDGQFIIKLEDYAIKRPSIFGLEVKDELTIIFHLMYPISTPDP
ncbi:YceI family protein [Pontibacter sp. MBLB2868]|uniref:YceI family protein n=1 Tax=Pontibacter sp. MBLB2868 TaxID=3451555 RepID=UPI003F74D715